jgi:hypothetical protein
MSAYIGDVVKNGLVLYLDAANSKSYPGSGTNWVDLTGNGNDGTLTNGPTFSSENKGSIGFDGGDDLIEIPYTPSANITGLNLTLSCWIRASAVANSNAGAGLIVRGSGQNDGLYEMLLLPSGSKNYAFFRMYQVGNYWPKLTPIELNTYYHICCVYDNGTARNYINAVQEGTGSVMNSNIVGGSSAVINKLRVGNRFSDGTARFSGRMSQVQIYNRALSSAEILENYNATKGRFDTPIVINSVQPRLVTNGLVMCLDAGNRESYVSGSSTIFDLSGTGNHGTLNNGPTFSSANNGSIVFDGTNDFISTTNSVNNPQTYTVAAWFKTSTGGGKKIIGFESSQVGAGGNYDRMLYIGANNKIYFGQYINGTVVAVSPSTYNDNIWHYIVGTYGSEGTTMRLYVDGVSVATAAASSAQNYTGWWKIGGINLNSWINGVNGYYTGNIAAAHVYNRGLSASEVLQNYNALKGRFGL